MRTTVSILAVVLFLSIGPSAHAEGGTPSFGLVRLEDSLAAAADGLYLPKARFLKAVAKALVEVPQPNSKNRDVYQARLMALLAIEPLLRETESAYVQDTLLPTYRKTASHFSRYRAGEPVPWGVSSIREISGSPLADQMAATLTFGALQGLRESALTVDERQRLDTLAALAARAVAAASPQWRLKRESVELLTAALRGPDGAWILDRGLRDPRYRALAATLAEVMGYWDREAQEP